MSVQYTGGVQYSGDVQYNGGCHEDTGDIISTLWVFSTLGDIMSTPGGYHDSCGERSLGKQLNLYGNPSALNIPQCTHDIQHSSWYLPTVLNAIPWCTAHPSSYPKNSKVVKGSKKVVVTRQKSGKKVVICARMPSTYSLTPPCCIAQDIMQGSFVIKVSHFFRAFSGKRVCTVSQQVIVFPAVSK